MVRLGLKALTPCHTSLLHYCLDMPKRLFTTQYTTESAGLTVIIGIHSM